MGRISKRGALLERIFEHGAAPDDESRQRILAAAVEQVEDFGVRRFTVDEVARRVRLSRVTIYRHFPKKDQLLEAVLLRELHRLLRSIDSAVRGCETLEQQLTEGFVFTLTFLREHRLLSRLLRTEPELILPALTVRGGPVLAAGREFVAGFARDEAHRGGLPLTEQQIDGVSELLARLVVSFLLTPDSAVPMSSPDEIRQFARTHLAPVLRMLSEGGTA